MTRAEVILKAAEGKITWVQAAGILGMTPRHLRRVRGVYERKGLEGLEDGRRGSAPARRINESIVAKVVQLKRERYADFSVRHFHERIREKHRLEISYTWTLQLLRAAGLAPKAAGRGKYRRKRERRPMEGMLLHLDASTHTWIAGLPMRDLVVMLDDATSKILYAHFVEEEGTASTMAAVLHVVRKYGRFCALYTDRASHFCRTTNAQQGPDEVQQGQVSRALRVLGIGQILARSPQARGRSERAFGTLQGRLPQELREAGIRDYDRANVYLQGVFLSDFNRRFGRKPAQPEKAYTRVEGCDLELLLSSQHQRTVRADNTVSFRRLTLQLPPGRDRVSYTHCPVLVHELVDQSLAVSWQGKRLARFDRRGQPLPLRGKMPSKKPQQRPSPARRPAGVRSLRSPAAPPPPASEPCCLG